MKRTYSQYTTQESQETLTSPAGKISRRMPYKNGSQISQRGKKRSSKYRSKSFNSKVKAVMLRSTESKYIQATTVENLVTEGLSPLYYDWPSVLQGDTSINREGNKILCTNIGMKTLYNNNSTTLSSYIRELVLEVDGGRYNSNSDITTALFEGSADTTWAGDLSDIVNRIQKDGIKVLYDRTINIAAQAVASFDSGNAGSKWYKYMNQSLLHRDSGGTQPTNKRYTVLVLARDPTNDGTVASGIEATVHRNMTFKDM